jgi:hypothetical protein
MVLTAKGEIWRQTLTRSKFYLTPYDAHIEPPLVQLPGWHGLFLRTRQGVLCLLLLLPSAHADWHQSHYIAIYLFTHLLSLED